MVMLATKNGGRGDRIMSRGRRRSDGRAVIVERRGRDEVVLAKGGEEEAAVTERNEVEEEEGGSVAEKRSAAEDGDGVEEKQQLEVMWGVGGDGIQRGDVAAEDQREGETPDKENGVVKAEEYESDVGGDLQKKEEEVKESGRGAEVIRGGDGAIAGRGSEGGVVESWTEAEREAEEAMGGGNLADEEEEEDETEGKTVAGDGIVERRKRPRDYAKDREGAEEKRRRTDARLSKNGDFGKYLGNKKKVEGEDMMRWRKKMVELDT